MKIQEVVDRALLDDEFAADLRARVKGRQRVGVEIPEWDVVLKQMAGTPSELTRIPLSSDVAVARAGKTTTTTLTVTTTFTMLTTFACTMTTTTSLTTTTGTTTDFPPKPR